MKKRKDGRYMRTFTVNGKRICFYSTETTEKKAMKDIERQLLSYQEREEKGKSFTEVADEWDSYYRTTIPEVTYNKGIRAIYARILDYFGDDYIRNITPNDVDVFFKHLTTYGQKTVSNHKSVLNLIFCYAVLHGEITTNPVMHVKIPRGLTRNKREIPSDHDLNIVSQNYSDFALLPYFILYTGCRKSEALAITDESIDFKNKVIKIRNHVIHNGNMAIFEPVLKSEAAHREIILLDRLYDVIPRKFKGFLFSMEGDGKRPLTKGAYDKRWKKYCSDYGVNITAHQLRHGYATMLYEAGIDIKDAQDLMGHSDITLTRSVYTHIRDSRKTQTAEQLNKFTF